MCTIGILNKSYLEASGIEQILTDADHAVITRHFAGADVWFAQSGERDFDVLFLDTGTLDGGLELFTRQLKKERPHTYIVWLSSEINPSLEFDAICAAADGCVAKHDFEAIISAVDGAVDGRVLFSKTILLDFARRASVLFSRPGHRIGELTRRERQVLELIREGATNKAIANRLFISIETVKIHVKSMRKKLGAASRRQLIEGVPCRKNESHIS